MNEWWIYRGTREPNDNIQNLPEPPNWRRLGFSKPVDEEQERRRYERILQLEREAGADARGAKFQASDEEIELINAALYLRRPLFVTGKPGTGKSSLAYAVAHELRLGPVLHWSITTRVTLQDGLYHYDAIGRLQDASLQRSDKVETAPDIGQYLRLGPLGTALLPTWRPRVLLIDEVDKGDIDLPNDLLNIFEEGQYDIPELARMAKHNKKMSVMPYDGVDDEDRTMIEAGKVLCSAFPFIVLTSNGEREFPPAFLRRCIRLEMQIPSREKLTSIVESHLGKEILPLAEQLITDFIQRRDSGDLATDQLLNAIYLTTQAHINVSDKETLRNALLRYLSGGNTI